MRPHLRLFSLVFTAALACTGCDLFMKPTPKARATPPPATPPLGPPAQRLSGDERLRVEDAMTFNDLSLLLRTNMPEADIMTEVAQRGFFGALTPAQIESLPALGASPRLVIVLKDPQYVLTPVERQASQGRAVRRDQAARGQVTANRKQAEAEFAERQKQLHLQRQTYDMAARAEMEKQRREGAKAAYEQRRKELESSIETLKTRITDYRRYGYKESDLKSMNRRLKEMQDELFNLKAP